MICPDCGGSPAMRDDIPCTHPCHQAAADVVDAALDWSGRPGSFRVPTIDPRPAVDALDAAVAALLATLEQGRGKAGALLPPAGDGKVAGIAAHHAPTPSPAPSQRDVEAARALLNGIAFHYIEGTAWKMSGESNAYAAQALATHARAAAERERERMERVCREVAHECYVRGRTYHFDGEKETPAEVFRQIEDYVTAAIRALPGEGECAKCAKCGLSGHTLTDCTAPVDLRGNGRSA